MWIGTGKSFAPRNLAALVGAALEGIVEDIERIPEAKRSKEGVSNIEGRSLGDHVIDHQGALWVVKWLIHACRWVAVVVRKLGIARTGLISPSLSCVPTDYTTLRTLRTYAMIERDCAVVWWSHMPLVTHPVQQEP
jgi:hypothetical protein